MTPSPRELVVATSSAVYGHAVRVAGEGAAARAAVRNAYQRAFEELAGFGGADATAWVCGFISRAALPIHSVPMPGPLLEELLDQADDVARRSALRRFKPQPLLLQRAARSRRRRLIAAVAVIVASAAVVAGLVWKARPGPAQKTLALTKAQRPPGPEPSELQSGVLLVDSFGQSANIDWPQQASKRLTFELARPAVAVLYFDGVGASVDVNGQTLDVRADVLAQEVVLPMTALRAGENVLTFRAADDAQEWRIENLWLYTLELKAGEEGRPELIAKRRMADLQGYGDIDPLTGFRASHDACLLGGLADHLDCSDWEWKFEHDLDAHCVNALQRGEELVLYDRPDVGCFRKVRAVAELPRE